MSPSAAGQRKRYAWYALAVFAALSMLVAVYPDPPARALVPASGIFIESGFTPTAPPRAFEVRKSVLKSPDLALWRTWDPTNGNVPGEAHTAPFHMPAHMLVPYQGFAGEPGIRLYVECMGSGATLDVAVARTNNQWAEAMVSRPKHWCSGNSRLVASSTSRSRYLAFGTPFRISTVSWLKTRAFGLLAPYLLMFGAIAGLCIFSSLVLRRLWPRGDELALGMIGLGVAGYAMFFLFFFSIALGRLAVIAAVLAAGWAITRWLKESLRPTLEPESPAKLVFAGWRVPLIAWLAVSSFYVFLLYGADNGAGAWLANARFAPVRWSTDNQLPMLVGEYLARMKLLELDLTPWLVSDRPPLSYGLHAYLRSLTLLLMPGNDGHYMAPMAHNVAGIVLNTAWVPVLAHLLRRLGMSPRNVVVAMVGAALLPFCLFNSVYIWPKLLAGSFGLLAIWVLLVKPSEAADEERGGIWVQAAMLSALALLSHGGTVFGIVAMLLFALFAAPRPRATTAIACAVLVAALLGPWMAWQKTVQPPGNALVKSVFAGTTGFDEPEVGVIETILRSYGKLPPETWLKMKGDALRSLALPATPTTCSYGEMVTGSTGMDSWRISDFASLVPSIKFLWLGLPILLLAAARKASAGHRPAWLLLGVGTGGIVIDALTAWECQIIHTQSYQSILAIVCAMLLVLLKLGPPRFGLAVVLLSAAYGVIVWVWDPLTEALRLDPVALIACASIAAAVAIRLFKLRDRGAA